MAKGTGHEGRYGIVSPMIPYDFEDLVKIGLLGLSALIIIMAIVSSPLVLFFLVFPIFFTILAAGHFKWDLNIGNYITYIQRDTRRKSSYNNDD